MVMVVGRSKLSDFLSCRNHFYSPFKVQLKSDLALFILLLYSIPLAHEGCFLRTYPVMHPQIRANLHRPLFLAARTPGIRGFLCERKGFILRHKSLLQSWDLLEPVCNGDRPQTRLIKGPQPPGNPSGQGPSSSHCCWRGNANTNWSD